MRDPGSVRDRRLTVPNSWQVTIALPWATLSPPDKDTLDRFLAFVDPRAEENVAYQEGRWDGMVREYNERGRFMAGLAPLVIDGLRADGDEVEVIDTTPRPSVNADRLYPDFLGDPITLRPHQFDGLLAAVAAGCGIVKLPTGTGKTFLGAALARFLWEETGERVLYVVPRIGLAVQTLAEFAKVYRGEVPLGLLADKTRDIGDINIASYQTLASGFVRNATRKVNGRKGKVALPADPAIDHLIRTAGVLIIDEHHHSSAKTLQSIAEKCQARWRFGFSATPLRALDLEDARVIGTCGPVVYSMPTQQAVEEGIISRPLIAMVASPNVSGPPLGNSMWYAQAYVRGVVENTAHNLAVLRAVEWIVDHGRQVLLLCRRYPQFYTLAAGLEARGISHLAVAGNTPLEERTIAKESFGAGQVRVLLGTEVMGEGEDIRSVEAVVLAEGVKVITNVLQRLGRGVRLKPHLGNTVWVVDFAPTCHRRLFDHALERCAFYEAEGHHVDLVEDWPAPTDQMPQWKTLLPFPPDVKPEAPHAPRRAAPRIVPAAVHGRRLD